MAIFAGIGLEANVYAALQSYAAQIAYPWGFQGRGHFHRPYVPSI